MASVARPMTALAEIFSISEADARFVTALFLEYIFAFGYHLKVVKLKPSVQNLYFTVSGMWTVFFVFGMDIWHSLVDIVTVYSILFLFGGSLLSVTLTWLVTMGHLICGYLVEESLREAHEVYWAFSHCVLVLKLVGLAYNYYDGQQLKKSQFSDKGKQEETVQTLPPFFEVTGFCYFFANVLSGPQVSFVRHHQLTTGTLYNREHVSGSVNAGLQQLVLGVVIMGMFVVLDNWFPPSLLLTDQFVDFHFLKRVLLVVATGEVALLRYISVWLLADGSCVITGVGFKEIKKDGTVDWSAVNNVHFWKYRTSLTFQSVIESFNVTTNRWIAQHVFKRLRWLNSKPLSLVISMLFLSIWHGLWSGFLLCFSYEIIAIYAERKFLSVSRKILGDSLKGLPWLVQIPLFAGTFAGRLALMNYGLALFQLLQWNDCWKFMWSVSFYGHVVCILWCLICQGLSPVIKI